MFESAAERRSIRLKAVHFAEADVARGAVEFLAEQVGDERIVAEFDQLAPKADFKIGDAHHGRDQDYRWPRLAVTAPDEYAFELLALEIVGDGPILTHWSS